MPISFNLIPSNIRTPGTYVEIDNSRALRGLPLFQTRILVLGQRRSTGSVAQATPVLVSSAEQAKTFFGQGSNLANMFKVLKANNKLVETWAIALDDLLAGVQATGTIVVSGPATANGTIYLYVAGRLITLGVTSGDSANTIAAALNTAINGTPDLPVTSTVNTATVTLTARHKGEIGNDIDVRANYYGPASGQVLPAGVGLTITQLSGGTGNPDIQTALDAIPEEIFDFVICPWADATNLGKLETELNGRWGPLQMLEGHAFIAKDDTVGNLTTFGNGRNSQFVSCAALDGSPTPAYEVASAFGAQVAYAATVDPGANCDGLTLVDVLPPVAANRFTQEERNTLLYDGISPLVVDRAGRVKIDRAITMYQTNQVFSPDPSYLETTTMTLLAYLRQSLRSRVSDRFQGFKIKDDTANLRLDPSSKITTPRGIAAEVVALAAEWEAAGLIENLAQFKQELIVERNAGDPTRVDIQLPPDLVNPLHIIAGQIQFLL